MSTHTRTQPWARANTHTHTHTQKHVMLTVFHGNNSSVNMPQLHCLSCYNWFLQSVHDGLVDTQFVFFPNQAWYSLRGMVNSQNSRYWSAKTTGHIHELPTFDETNWCLVWVSARRVIGPIFYDGMVHAVKYAKNVLRPFFAGLLQEENAYGSFPARFCHNSRRTCEFRSCSLWHPPTCLWFNTVERLF